MQNKCFLDGRYILLYCNSATLLRGFYRSVKLHEIKQNVDTNMLLLLYEVVNPL